MNPIESIQEFLREKITEAVNQAVQNELLAIETIPEFVIEAPGKKPMVILLPTSLCYWPVRPGWHPGK